MRTRRRKKIGSGMVEAVTAAIVLVPLALAFVDVLTVVMANSMNDTAAKNAARAAANQADPNTALDAANQALSTFHKSSIVTTLSLEVAAFDYVPGESVTVKTKLIVHLPVPFPGLSDITFMAQDVEPIVAQH